MSKFYEYLQHVYQEKMEGSYIYGNTHHEIKTGKGVVSSALTYQLELINNKIVGFINNKDIGELTIEEFTKKYPTIAKQVLTALKQNGSAKFIPDKKPPYDFVQAPTTGNKIKVTPDIEDE